MKLAVLMLACVSAVSAAAADNPLLSREFRIPFDQIKPEQVVPATEQRLAEAQKQRDAFVASLGPRTYANTLEALDGITEDLERTTGIVQFLDGVHASPELRAALGRTLPKLTAFNSSLRLDPAVYAKVKEYAATPEAKELTGYRKRYLEQTLKRFHRGGADLGEADKNGLKAISVELAELTRKFANDVLDATNAFELIIKDEAQLAGLPAGERAAARESARKKGVEGWRFTLQEPSYRAVITYLNDAAIREKVYRAYNTRATAGADDNRPVMQRMLELRRERARLLGYKTYADLQTEERMARSGDRVRAFLDGLEKKTRPFYDKENEELLAFRRGIEGPQAPPLAAWDISYYAEKMRNARYDFDEEALRPYFPMPSVMKGMFEVVEKLYGIQIVPAAGVPVWNPAVEYFEVRDADQSLLGAFYADWHPREDKRAGGWTSTLIVGGPLGPRFLPHLGAINGNMTAPEGGKPALLTHREVETVFHEFGHLLRLVLSRVPEKGLNYVAWDFVEMPSQIMENFTWDRQCLDLFARHYQTGERIPEELFQKMVRARNFRSANAQMRQLAFGTMDLALHTEYRGGQDGDIPAYARKVMQRFTPAPLPEDYAMVAGFSHIFAGGYAAGYYSYKWAEVLDADAFTRFQKEGVFNRKAGMEFRRKILERGAVEDPDVLFRNFMGRDADPDALLRRSGLTAEK